MSDLLTKLKRKLQLVDTESRSTGAFTDPALTSIITDAISEHSSTLTLAQMTQAEELPVLLLAEVECCYIRASIVAPNDPMKAPANVASYGNAGKTPFDRWMAVAAALMQRYQTVVSRLGGSIGAETVVVQSTVYKYSDRLDAIITRGTVPIAAPAYLSATIDQDGEVDIQWEAQPSPYFRKFVLFWSLTPNIYRQENSRGVFAVPRISPSAQMADCTEDQTNGGVVIGNFPSASTIYLLLATVCDTCHFAYSNEVSVTTP